MFGGVTRPGIFVMEKTLIETPVADRERNGDRRAVGGSVEENRGEEGNLDGRVRSGADSVTAEATAEKVYSKELTVAVEIQGEENITPMELMKSIRELCGGILACRCKNTRRYEITMSHPIGKRRLLDGLKIGSTQVLAKEITNDELVVSFLELPAYIKDEEIVAKLHGWGVTVTSPIKRRMWPGTNIADGTRFMKVRFNDRIQSLPYSTKFTTAAGSEYFRVIHDRQAQVCRLCIQPGHIFRECPEFLCRKCGQQGHYARECHSRLRRCEICHNNEDNCICNYSEDQEEEEEETELCERHGEREREEGEEEGNDIIEEEGGVMLEEEELGSSLDNVSVGLSYDVRGGGKGGGGGEGGKGADEGGDGRGDQGGGGGGLGLGETGQVRKRATGGWHTGKVDKRKKVGNRGNEG